MLTKKNIKIIEIIIKKAGIILKDSFYKQKKIKRKKNNEFYTNIDLKVEKFLISELKMIFPEAQFISEESNPKIVSSLKKLTWIIDPIDGTNNYINSHPHFSISVALKFNNICLLGLVYDPLRDEMFKSINKEGSYLNNKKINPSQTKLLKNAVLGLGIVKSDVMAKKYIKKYDKIYFSLKSIRNSGSAALDLAYLASGRIDACFLLGLNPWDVEAGILLLSEAGVKLSIDSDKSIKIIASNKFLFDKINSLIEL